MEKIDDLGRVRFTGKSETPFLLPQATMNMALEHLIQILGFYEPIPDGISSIGPVVGNNPDIMKIGNPDQK